MPDEEDKLSHVMTEFILFKTRSLYLARMAECPCTCSK